MSSLLHWAAGRSVGWVPPREALTDKLKADFPAIADAQDASVTALEIIHGVLSNPETAACACFFERDPNWDWLATLPEAHRSVATAEPASGCTKLEELKTLIRGQARVERMRDPRMSGAT